MTPEQDPPTKPPFYLIPDVVSKDVVVALQELLASARRGHLIGFGFVAMYKDRSYITNTAGEADRNPTFTRGMIKALDDELAKKITKKPPP